MAITNINGTFTMDDAFVNPVDCPVCSHNVVMSLFINKDNALVSLLKNKSNESHMAFCPKCESFFSVNENYIKERDSGTTVTMTADDLEVIIKGKKCGTV